MKQAASRERPTPTHARMPHVDARALGNAHRHGLTVPIRADPRWRAAVVVLERELVIEAPAARRFAGMAAEGVMELRRIAQARAALMGRLEGDAEIDALRRLARYEGLAYAKKDKGLRVIAAHRLVRDCAAALRCCRNVAIRKTTACETPANSEAPDPAARPAGDRHELCHRTRRPCHRADPRSARGARRHRPGERGSADRGAARLRCGRIAISGSAVGRGRCVLRRLRPQIRRRPHGRAPPSVAKARSRSAPLRNAASMRRCRTARCSPLGHFPMPDRRYPPDIFDHQGEHALDRRRSFAAVDPGQGDGGVDDHVHGRPSSRCFSILPKRICRRAGLHVRECARQRRARSRSVPAP